VGQSGPNAGVVAIDEGKGESAGNPGGVDRRAWRRPQIARSRATRIRHTATLTVEPHFPHVISTSLPELNPVDCVASYGWSQLISVSRADSRADFGRVASDIDPSL